MAGPRFVSWLDDPTRVIANHKRAQQARRASLSEGETNLQLFHDRPATNLTTTDGNQIVTMDGLRDLGFNVLAECALGANSQICKPLQAKLAPVGGTWSTLKACESMGRLIDGVMDNNKFLRLAGMLVVHGQLCGNGFGLWEADPITKDFRASMLDPLDTFMSSDETEVTTVRLMSRRRAKAWVKGYAKGHELKDLQAAIALLPAYEPRYIVGVDAFGQFDAEDNIAWYEAWALPVGDEPGRHVIQFTEQVFIEERWDHSVLPVFKFTWADGHRGHIDGRPMGRDVAATHFWLNEMVRKMYDALRGAKPMVIGESDPMLSDVSYEFIQTKPGEKPFQVVTPNPVSQDVRQHIVDLREQAHRATGTSEEAAAGAAPPQFKSGIALQTWRQIVNERLSRQHQAYEELWTQSGRIIATLSPRVYASGKARTRAIGSKLIESIDFSKIKLPEDGYVLSFDAISDLPKHIPAKLEFMSAISEMAPEVVDVGDVLARLDIVDLKAITERINGPKALIEKQIDKALSDGEILAPTEAQDAAMGVKMVGQAWQAAMASYMQPPRANLEACRRLYRLFKARDKKTAPALPTLPPVPPVGGAPALAPATQQLPPVI